MAVRSCRRLQELETVAKRIERVETTHTRKVVVPLNFDTSIDEAFGEVIKAADQDSRVRLRRGAEIGLDSEVHFEIAAPKPASTASGKRRRLFDLGKPKDVAPELTTAVLRTGRNRQLHMVQTAEGCSDVVIHATTLS